MTTPLADSRDGLAASDDVATPSDDTLLTIGELSEHTGLSTQLLRTWETRFGFPEPTRLPSGHRRYTGRGRPRRAAGAGGARPRHAPRAGHRGRAARRGRHPERLGLRLPEPAPPRADVVHAQEEHPAGAVLGDRGRGDRPGRRRACSWGPSSAVATSGSPPSAGSDFARTARGSLAMADFPEHDDDARPAQVALSPDSPLLREWIVVHDAPTFAAALVAWELPGQGDVRDADRHFEALWTVEGRIVRDVAVTVRRGRRRGGFRGGAGPAAAARGVAAPAGHLAAERQRRVQPDGGLHGRDDAADAPSLSRGSCAHARTGP